jgi:hypothetical protein
MTDVSNLSDLVDCSVEIEVTGMSRQALMRSGASTIKVPFSSLSRTIQFIHRSGGKVVKVTRLSGTSTISSVPIATTPQPAETEAVVVETIPALPEPAAVETTPVELEPVVAETEIQTSAVSSPAKSKTPAHKSPRSGKSTTKRGGKNKHKK